MRVVTARRLVDGTGGPPLDRPALVVDDAGRLTYVGPISDAPPVPPGTPRDDLGECTLLPGIVDSHVHLAFDGGPDPVAAIQATDDQTLLLEMAERARRMLQAGITTVRDCGARGGLDLVLRRAIAGGTVPGPRLVVSGSPLTIAQGHCHYLGGVTEPDEASVRAAARAQLDAGVDWVKMMVSGGRITPGSDATKPQFERAAVRAAADEAHAAGRRLAAHAHATGSIADAVAAGADSVEHCSWISPDDNIVYAPAIAEEMAARGVYACPTTNFRMASLAERRGGDWLERRLSAVAQMRAAGVRLAFGTDCGIPHVVHDRWAGGLIWFEQSGFSPAEVIQVATGDAAACIGVGEQVGTLTAGKAADLIAVDGDPTTDLGVLERLTWVLQGGRVVG